MQKKRRDFNKSKIYINQKGFTFVIFLMLSTTFILLGTIAIYISMVNSKNTRRAVEAVSSETSTDAGLSVSLEKVKRFMMSGNLTQFKPNVNFGYTKDQMQLIKSNLSSLIASSNLDNDLATYGVINDDSGTTPSDKILSDETFDKIKNYYSFTSYINGKQTKIKYRIIDENNWNITTDKKAEKKVTVYSISSQDNGLSWQGSKADINILRENVSAYGVFFRDDLEILPGAAMSFKGKIFTNKNMYLGGQLTLGTSTRGTDTKSAGHIYVGRKDDNTGTGDTVNVYYEATDGTIKNNNNLKAETDSINTSKLNSFNSNDLEKPSKSDGLNNDDTWKVATNTDNTSKWNTNTVDSKQWDWKSGASKRWNNSIMDSSHGIETKTPPKIQDIQPGGAYEQKAGLVIKTSFADITGGKRQEIIQVVDQSKAPTDSDYIVYKKTAVYSSSTAATPTTTTTNVNKLGITANSSSNPPIKADPFDNLKFQDGREKATALTTTIDIASLQKSSKWPSSGLIYASRSTDTSNTGSNPSGFMLQNGATLSKELNFVTNNPVYVRGDFNKHKLASNNATIEDTDSRAGTNLDTWKPASIISDATTMLSNAWNPNNSNYQPKTGSNQSANSPTQATSTEYNFTMVTGNVPTNRSTSTYSGGLENFPRFLESWGSSAEVKFRGSMVQLWNSTFATTPWGGGYYSAPKRNWGYDEAFERANLSQNFSDMFPSITDSITLQNWRSLLPNDPIFDKNDTLSIIY